VEAGGREELRPCRGWTLGTVRIVNLVNGRQHLLAVGKELDQWRFVRDEGAYLAWMSSGECKSRDSAAAASEHIRWFCRDDSQQAVHIVGDQVGMRILAGVIDRATRDASGVVRHDCIVTREQGGD